jgi:hypothetical protein
MPPRTAVASIRASLPRQRNRADAEVFENVAIDRTNKFAFVQLVRKTGRTLGAQTVLRLRSWYGR